MVVAPRSYLLILLAVLLLSPAPSPAAAASREVDEETQAYLTKGFELLAQNQLAAAQEQFALVIKKDFDNPFANNNLAVIMEKQGRWPDALAYLKVAEVQAGDYQQRIETLYLIGGVVAAVKPAVGPERRRPAQNSGAVKSSGQLSGVSGQKRKFRLPGSEKGNL